PRHCIRSSRYSPCVRASTSYQTLLDKHPEDVVDDIHLDDVARVRLVQGDRGRRRVKEASARPSRLARPGFHIAERLEKPHQLVPRKVLGPGLEPGDQLVPPAHPVLLPSRTSMVALYIYCN